MRAMILTGVHDLSIQTAPLQASDVNIPRPEEDEVLIDFGEHPDHRQERVQAEAVETADQQEHRGQGVDDAGDDDAPGRGEPDTDAG